MGMFLLGPVQPVRVSVHDDDDDDASVAMIKMKMMSV